MVNKKPTKAPKHHHSAHLSSKITTTSSSILLSSFSPSHLSLSLFASTVLGLDVQRLRIHDTTTGRLRCEYVFDKGAMCNSISWSTVPADDLEDDGKTKKKKRKRMSSTNGSTAEHDGTSVMALGMNKGNILLYSPTEGSLIGSLEGAHTGEVTSFKFSDEPGKGWSCGTDGKLVEWDLRRKTTLRAVPLPDPSIRVLAPAPPTVFCASHTVYSINLEVHGNISKFAANASPIHDLIVSSDPAHSHFLTAAEADRYINVFSVTQQKQVGALVAESDVKHLSTSRGHGGDGLEVLAAVTADGVVEIFSHPWQPAPANVSNSLTISRKAKATTRKADSKIQVLRPKTKETVSIVNSSFQPGGELIFAWVESGVNVEFDRIRWQNADDGSLVLNGLVEVTKAKSLGLGSGTAGNAVQMNGAKDMGKSHVDQTRTVVISGVDTQDMGMVDAVDASDAAGDESDNANDSEEEASKHAPEEPSFSDKFQALEVSATDNNVAAKVSKALAPAAESKAIKPSSGSLTTVLTQALKTDDSQLLESCLTTTDSKTILNTIRRLDSTYAVTLIEKLSDRIARRPGRAATLGVWVRWTIVAHGGYLLSLPNLMMTLAGLHSTLAIRAGALPKLLQLQGRLDMLNAQLELRNSLRKGVGETGVDLAEEEEQIEEGVLYIEGKTRDNNDDSEDEDDGSDEEPEEVGMEGLQIEDASFIQGKLDGSDDDEEEEEEQAEDEDKGSEDEDDAAEDEDEGVKLNGAVSEEDEEEDPDEDEDSDEDDDGDDDAEVVERYGGLIDDEAEESDGEDSDEEISDDEPVASVKKPAVVRKTPAGKKR